jgi:hypothetical protein
MKTQSGVKTNQNISLSRMKFNLIRTKKSISSIENLKDVIEPLLTMMGNASFSVQNQGTLDKARIQNILLANVNRQLKILRNFGRFKGMGFSTEISQKLQKTVNEVRDFRLHLGTEMLKTITEYAPLADAVRNIIQFVDNVTLLIESRLEWNIKQFKTK